MSESKPPFPKFPEQNADGVDLSLIRANMRLDPTERLRKADSIVRGMQRLRAQQAAHSRRILDVLRARDA